MAAEEDEAPLNQSPPPLQQPSDSPLPDLPINADIHQAGELEAVVAGETSDAAAVNTEVVVDDVAPAEGGEMHAMDGIEDEIVVVEKKEDEGTEVDLEPENVEEAETNLIIGEEEVQIRDDENTDEAPPVGDDEEEEDNDEKKGEEENEKEDEEGDEIEDEKVEEGDEIEEDEKVEEGDGIEEDVKEEEGDEEIEEAGEQEQEQEEEEEEDDDEETEVDGDGGLTEDKEAAEDMEVTEEEQSVSGGKRKRGNAKTSKSTGRVPSKKKMEEDVCFICFDGGDLVLCDRRGCPKAYHPSCINRDEAFFQSKGKWNCGFDFEPRPPVYEAATLLLCQGSKYINCPIRSFRAMISRHVERDDFLANERISMSREWRFDKPFVDLKVFASASA
ncbi:hypothetical protein TSUD_309950 [Trifolium subterraneum]|uniref:Zinc finger PHD-type domain-containing protein n=1 Tax=Trifolium subterraneum TaxID=3900 RepID=A0A2Z6LSC6_TRISU|nr:hypothetical protein TSUD_309950 [Trifolium subterraneum]